MRKYLVYSTCLFAAFSFSACKDDIANADLNIKYQAALGVPIGKANFDVEDIITNFYKGDELYVDNSSRYFFTTSDSAKLYLRDINLLPQGQTVTAKDFFLVRDAFTGLPDGTITDISTLDLAGQEFSLKNKTFIDFSIKTSGEEERIDSAIIEHSELTIKLTKPGVLGMKVKKFEIDFPMKYADTGAPVTLKLQAENGQELEFGKEYKFSLDNFRVGIEKNPLEPDKDNGGFSFETSVDAVLESGTLTTGAEVGYEVTYTIFDHKIVYGYFAPDPNTARVKTALNFKLLRDLNESKGDGKTAKGVLLFDDVRMHLNLKNYDIGMKVGITLDSLKGVMRDEPSKGYKLANFNGETGKALFFSRRPNQPYKNDVIQNMFTLDKTHGEVQNFFQEDFTADRFEFVFSIGSVTSVADEKYPMFLTSDSRIDCDVRFEIPMNLRPGSYYLYRDTIPSAKATFSSKEFGYLKKASLIIGMENGLPIGMEVSFQLFDKNGNEIKSDLSKESFIVKRPATNKNGEVIVDKTTLGIEKGEFVVELSEQVIEDLKRTEKMYFTAKASNDGDTENNICFMETNRFNISLALFAEGVFEGNLK